MYSELRRASCQHRHLSIIGTFVQASSAHILISSISVSSDQNPAVRAESVSRNVECTTRSCPCFSLWLWAPEPERATLCPRAMSWLCARASRARWFWCLIQIIRILRSWLFTRRLCCLRSRIQPQTSVMSLSNTSSTASSWPKRRIDSALTASPSIMPAYTCQLTGNLATNREGF